MLLMIFIHLIVINANNTSSFRTMPMELRRLIFNLVPCNNAILNLSLLNRQIYQECYIPHHQYQSNKITQLYSLINSSTDTSKNINLTQITIITQQLQLSELYISHLPYLLQSIDNNNELLIRLADRGSLIDAMNIKSMSVAEYNQLSFDDKPPEIQCKLKLLILASRSLAPIPYSNISLGPFKLTWQEFPWCLVEEYSAHLPFFVLLYKFLFDTYHQQLNLPKLSCLQFDDGSKQISNLKYLIAKYHFIPWNNCALRAIWKMNDNIDIDEFVRIETLLLEQLPLIRDEFMHQWIKRVKF
eukprot:548452_1